MIQVTKTFLPPQGEYQKILARAWEEGWITNRGILVQELEAILKKYLEVPEILLMTNGTLPLQIAIKAMELSGEIITTPFSYVATTSSIVWEGCTPVFVDIHPEYLTIDETQIEAAITPKTTAILATHVFGNPCHVEAIHAIAQKHNLKVIYDAAHGFGVKYQQKSLFNYGDVSTCSFHATKIFHTGEGGALITQDAEWMNRFFYHHNFGHEGKEKFQGLGVNAKMSELQAAMGLSVFPYMESIFEGRRRVVEKYLAGLQGISFLKIREGTEWNYSYFPVLFKNEAQLLRVMEVLGKEGVVPRRYFYPNLESLPYLKKTEPHPIAESVSRRVLCLPLYEDLEPEIQEMIIKLINTNL